MTRAITLSGACLIALGALPVVETLRWRDDGQGAKLMPAVIGVILLLE